MITFSLQSGSNGNSIYVEAGGVRLLFDAGISGRKAAQRMAEHGRDIRSVDALIISHDHGDHVCCAGIFHRLFGLPLFMTPGTHRAARFVLGKVGAVRRFSAGETLEFGAVRVHSLRTPHDAAESVAFIIEHDGRRLGIFSDLGHPFFGLCGAIESVDAAYIESNYDPQMLAEGDYPEDVKARIRGDRGHLSNPQAAGLLAGYGRKLKWAALAHLSEHNNHPQVALDTHRRVLGGDYPLTIARRDGVSELLTV